MKKLIILIVWSLFLGTNSFAQETQPDGAETTEWKTMESEKKKPSAETGIRADTEKKILIVPKFKFIKNSANPTSASLLTLKKVAKFLGKNPEMSIRIESHSDSIGSDQANLEITLKRADRVKTLLVEEGVSTDRLDAVGLGDKRLIASDYSPGGPEKNRRLEFHIMTPETHTPLVQPKPSSPSAPLPPLPPLSGSSTPPPVSPPPPVPPIPHLPETQTVPPETRFYMPETKSLFPETHPPWPLESRPLPESQPLLRSQ